MQPYQGCIFNLISRQTYIALAIRTFCPSLLCTIIKAYGTSTKITAYVYGLTQSGRMYVSRHWWHCRFTGCRGAGAYRPCTGQRKAYYRKRQHF